MVKSEKPIPICASRYALICFSRSLLLSGSHRLTSILEILFIDTAAKGGCITWEFASAHRYCITLCSLLPVFRRLPPLNCVCNCPSAMAGASSIQFFSPLRKLKFLPSHTWNFESTKKKSKFKPEKPDFSPPLTTWQCDVWFIATLTHLQLDRDDSPSAAFGVYRRPKLAEYWLCWLHHGKVNCVSVQLNGGH